MITLQHCKTGLAIAAMLAAAGAFAATGDKIDYKAAKDRVSAEYKADKAACDKFSGNQKDICVEQAKGQGKAALAETEYNYTGKPADADKVAVDERRDADYRLAAEKCDSLAGDAKSACISAAKARYGKS